jgi:hypothetical protein
MIYNNHSLLPNLLRIFSLLLLLQPLLLLRLLDARHLPLDRRPYFIDFGRQCRILSFNIFYLFLEAVLLSRIRGERSKVFSEHL